MKILELENEPLSKLRGMAKSLEYSQRQPPEERDARHDDPRGGGAKGRH